MNLLQSRSLDFQSHKFPCSYKCHTRDIENIWSILNPPLVYTPVCLSLCVCRSQKCCGNNTQSRSFSWKNVGLVYYKEKKKIKRDRGCLCCRWERCISCFRGRNHRTVSASMWLLSQWGNTDQVVQWVQAGVVKSSSEENFTGRNKVSLCGLRAQAVFPLQMWAALWGPLCFYANAKDDSDSPS